MPDDDYGENDGSTPEDESPVVRQLRQQVKTLEKDAAEAPELRKKLALSDAGLGSLNEIQRKALLNTHDGDLTPEALTATATSLGFIEAPKQEPQVPAEEQAALGRVAEATAGAAASDAQVASFEDQLAAAKSQDEAAAIAERHGIRVV